MNVNSVLKKDGIEVINTLGTLEINKIASSISEKICSSFPEYNLNQSDLFISIARLNMYVAKLPKGISAKYFYKNNSIYFNESTNLNNLDTLALHECIHFLQEQKDKRGKLIRLGLFDVASKSQNGLALNEAAVQLMASEANKADIESVKYYGMDLKTISPIYYPLECALVSQMAYFTGTYPLYYSTLFGNSVFENTFVAKTDYKTFKTIEYNLDLMLSLETEISESTSALENLEDENISKIRNINLKIANLKAKIANLCIDTQNLIIESCFTKEFNSIRDMKELKDFKEHLYNFKDILISTDDYTFFNTFYCSTMTKLEEKKEQIEKYGILTYFEDLRTDIAIIERENIILKTFKTLIKKIGLLLGTKQKNEE